MQELSPKLIYEKLILVGTLLCFYHYFDIICRPTSTGSSSGRSFTGP